MAYPPYAHQDAAFDNLSGPLPISTLVATGTGSGKTECFLYPILHHCLEQAHKPGIKAILIYPMNALATDQACLIRRLKDRLHTPEGGICCVATSATLGDKSQGDRLLAYAQCIFGEPFDRSSLITEKRKTAGEFLGDAMITSLTMPDPDREPIMDPDQYTTRDAYLEAQFPLCFNGNVPDGLLHDNRWRMTLGQQLKGHLLFQNLIKVLQGGTIWPANQDSLENLAKYIIRACFSQERMVYIPVEDTADGVAKVIYTAKDGNSHKTFDAVLNKIPWFVKLGMRFYLKTKIRITSGYITTMSMFTVQKLLL